MFNVEIGEEKVTLECTCGNKTEIPKLALQVGTGDLNRETSESQEDTTPENRAERKLDEIAEDENNRLNSHKGDSPDE